MILESTGPLTDEIFAIGAPALPGYLITGQQPALIESGMSFMGPRYVADLKDRLGDEHRLCFNFLTHSHFDHAGAAPYLKKKIRGLQLGAHRLAAQTFAKPGAIELIRRLNGSDDGAAESPATDEDVVFSDPRVDILLEDGMEIELGHGLSLRAIATPGHTRDCLSYFIPELKALFPGEAAGTMNQRLHIQTDFLSSYRDYMASLEKLAAIDYEILLLGHHYTLTGEDAATYIRRSIEEAGANRRRIAAYLDESHGDRDAVVRRIYQEDYVEAKLIPMALQPYLINLDAKVRVVAEGK